jgi:hypothetical protein
VRLALPAILFTAVLVAPTAEASSALSARLDIDRGKAVSLSSFVTVTESPGSLLLTTRRDWVSSPALSEWKISLGLTESLAQLPDGSVAIVAPWPPDITGPGDGTDYTSPEGSPGETDHTMAPLPESDPYRYSADPDGSMAADEALHDVGPFDPRYSDEYLPDTESDDPTDPDSPANANSGPAPGPDTSDPIDASDDEYVPESDPLDAIYEAEASRSDQIVALIGAPQASDALGRHVAARLRVTARDSVELRFGPGFVFVFPLTATSSVTFNPDASTAS